jgi:recombination protein RecA
MALKYFASVRVQFTRIRQNKGIVVDPLTNTEAEVPTSSDVRVKVVKNKVAPPFREAAVRVRFGKGFDPLWTAMQILLANKKVIYSASRYYFHNLAEVGGAPDWMPKEAKGTERPYLHGEKRVFAMADVHTEWRDLLIRIATQVARDNAESLKIIAPVREETAEEDSDEVNSEDLDGLIERDTTGNRVEI